MQTEKRRTRPVWYVGLNGTREVFRWTLRREPEPGDHAHRYAAVIGPHRTLRGAQYMASPMGTGNPLCQTADQADRAARWLAL
jgi:hypothetical protein